MHGGATPSSTYRDKMCLAACMYAYTCMPRAMVAHVTLCACVCTNKQNRAHLQITLAGMVYVQTDTYKTQLQE